MAGEPPLSLAGRSSLLAFLKVVADGEITCERSRQCLCEAHDFVPHEVFRVLQGSPPKGYISVRDVHSWLSDQPHRLPRMLQEDVAAFVLPYGNHSGELRYESFLKMLLPKDDPALREVCLNRNATGPWSHARDAPGGYASAETSYRICRLFEEEIELARHLHFHRKALRDQGVTPRDTFSFLCSEKSSISTVGYLSQTELRCLLVDRLGELSCQQCEALFRRASAASSGGLTYEDAVHLLRPYGEEEYARPLSPSAWRGSPRGPISPSRPYMGLAELAASDPLASSRRFEELRVTPALKPLSPTNTKSSTMDVLSAEIISPRSALPPISPRGLDAYSTPNLARSLGATAPRQPNHELQAVLTVIERQGQLDQHVEEMKAFLPSATPVEAVFGLLDVHRKGHVSDTDLWQFSQKMGRLPFSSIFALIREVQNGRYHDTGRVSGQLSLRELGVLVLRKGSPEFEALDGATSDEEARSSLYVLRFTEPCPGCGMRIQRDADAAGCPNVTCPVCRKGFQCYALMGDAHTSQVLLEADSGQMMLATLPSTVQHDLFRVVEASAAAADELEGLRKQLMLGHSDNILADTFALISGGRHAFTFVDLRRVLFQHKHWSSERELQLIWSRYARGADSVTLASYAQQLQPVMGRI